MTWNRRRLTIGAIVIAVLAFIFVSLLARWRFRQLD